MTSVAATDGLPMALIDTKADSPADATWASVLQPPGVMRVLPLLPGSFVPLQFASNESALTIPLGPAGPARPAKPAGPAGPVSPVAPAVPAGPAGPADPVAPTGPSV